MLISFAFFLLDAIAPINDKIKLNRILFEKSGHHKPMKLLSYRRHLRRNFLLCLITFCFSLTGVSPSFSSESVNYIHNIQRQLLEINAPSLPPLRDSSVYLYSPDEVSNFQLVLRLKKKSS